MMAGFWMPNKLEQFAKNIDTDFIYFGGVEQGPEAEKFSPEKNFRFYTFSRPSSFRKKGFF